MKSSKRIFVVLSTILFLEASALDSYKNRQPTSINYGVNQRGQSQLQSSSAAVASSQSASNTGFSKQNNFQVANFGQNTQGIIRSPALNNGFNPNVGTTSGQTSTFNAQKGIGGGFANGYQSGFNSDLSKGYGSATNVRSSAFSSAQSANQNAGLPGSIGSTNLYKAPQNSGTIGTSQMYSTGQNSAIPGSNNIQNGALNDGQRHTFQIGSGYPSTYNVGSGNAFGSNINRGPSNVQNAGTNAFSSANSASSSSAYGSFNSAGLNNAYGTNYNGGSNNAFGMAQSSTSSNAFGSPQNFGLSNVYGSNTVLNRAPNNPNPILAPNYAPSLNSGSQFNSWSQNTGTINQPLITEVVSPVNSQQSGIGGPKSDNGQFKIVHIPLTLGSQTLQNVKLPMRSDEKYTIKQVTPSQTISPAVPLAVEQTKTILEEVQDIKKPVIYYDSSKNLPSSVVSTLTKVESEINEILDERGNKIVVNRPARGNQYAPYNNAFNYPATGNQLSSTSSSQASSFATAGSPSQRINIYNTDLNRNKPANDLHNSRTPAELGLSKVLDGNGKTVGNIKPVSQQTITTTSAASGTSSGIDYNQLYNDYINRYKTLNTASSQANSQASSQASSQANSQASSQASSQANTQASSLSSNQDSSNSRVSQSSSNSQAYTSATSANSFDINSSQNVISNNIVNSLTLADLELRKLELNKGLSNQQNVQSTTSTISSSSAGTVDNQYGTLPVQNNGYTSIYPGANIMPNNYQPYGNNLVPTTSTSHSQASATTSTSTQNVPTLQNNYYRPVYSSGQFTGLPGTNQAQEIYSPSGQYKAPIFNIDDNTQTQSSPAGTTNIRPLNENSPARYGTVSTAQSSAISTTETENTNGAKSPSNYVPNNNNNFNNFGTYPNYNSIDWRNYQNQPAPVAQQSTINTGETNVVAGSSNFANAQASSSSYNQNNYGSNYPVYNAPSSNTAATSQQSSTNSNGYSSYPLRYTNQGIFNSNYPIYDKYRPPQTTHSINEFTTNYPIGAQNSQDSVYSIYLDDWGSSFSKTNGVGSNSNAGGQQDKSRIPIYENNGSTNSESTATASSSQTVTKNSELNTGIQENYPINEQTATQSTEIQTDTSITTNSTTITEKETITEAETDAESNSSSDDVTTPDNTDNESTTEYPVDNTDNGGKDRRRHKYSPIYEDYYENQENSETQTQSTVDQPSNQDNSPQVVSESDSSSSSVAISTESQPTDDEKDDTQDIVKTQTEKTVSSSVETSDTAQSTAVSSSTTTATEGRPEEINYFNVPYNYEQLGGIYPDGYFYEGNNPLYQGLGWPDYGFQPNLYAPQYPYNQPFPVQTPENVQESITENSSKPNLPADIAPSSDATDTTNTQSSATAESESSVDVVKSNNGHYINGYPYDNTYDYPSNNQQILNNPQYDNQQQILYNSGDDQIVKNGEDIAQNIKTTTEESIDYYNTLDNDAEESSPTSDASNTKSDSSSSTSSAASSSSSSSSAASSASTITASNSRPSSSSSSSNAASNSGSRPSSSSASTSSNAALNSGSSTSTSSSSSSANAVSSSGLSSSSSSSAISNAESDESDLSSSQSSSSSTTVVQTQNTIKQVQSSSTSNRTGIAQIGAYLNRTADGTPYSRALEILLKILDTLEQYLAAKEIPK